MRKKAPINAGIEFMEGNVWVVAILGTVVSFLFPAIGILINPLLQPLFMAFMFLSVLDIEIKEVLTDMKKPTKTLVVLLIVQLVSPAIIFLFRNHVVDDVYIGLILAAIAPSAVSAIFLSKVFGGEPHKSLIVTVISNLLSPLTIPFLMILFAQTRVHVGFLDMSATIFKLIVVPFVLAQLFAKTSYKDTVSKRSTGISVFLLSVIIVGTLSPLHSFVLDNLYISLTLSGIVALLGLINFLFGYSIGNTQKSKVSYAISASYKNFTLSAVLAMSLFGGIVALPSIIYSIIGSLCMIPMKWFLEAKRMGYEKGGRT